MRKRNLYASVSIVALSLGVTSVAFADPPDITQTGVENTGVVSITGDSKITGAGDLGVAATVSIGAAGASASVSGTGIGLDFTTVGDDDTKGSVSSAVGKIDQGVSNTTSGAVSVTNTDITIVDSSSLASGASAGISALGASSSVSFSGLTAGTYTAPSIVEVNQNSANTGNVTNTGNKIVSATGDAATGPVLTGDASSLSLNATGAASSVSLRAVDATNFTATDIGLTSGVTQQSTNNEDGTVSLQNGEITANVLSGVGASVGGGASAAVASVNTTSINSGDFNAKIGDIGQTVSNADDARVQGTSLTTLGVTGEAASVGLSATGASAGVSETFISQNKNTQSEFGNITQGVTGTAAGSAFVENSEIETGDLGAAAAGGSVRVSAVAATGSVGSSLINSDGLTGATFGTVGQTVTNTSNATMGKDGTPDDNAEVKTGALLGPVNSVGINALGAAGSVSSTTIGGGGNTGANFGAVTQTITNQSGGAILNTDSALEVGAISGVAASASIGAVGATGSTGSTIVSGGDSTGATVASVVSNVENKGQVTTVNAALDGGVLNGTAASVGISALGASSGASSTIVNSGAADDEATGATFTGAVTLSATNTGVVSNTTNELKLTGAVEGTAASATISGTGAATSAGSTVISSTVNGAKFDGAINQTAANNAGGTITVTGTDGDPDVSVAGVSGTAASAGMAATGASAGVSSTLIASASTTATTFDAVTQDSSNAAPVTLQDAQVGAGGVSGTAASTSLSALGASASVGQSAIESSGELASFGTITQTVSSDQNVNNTKSTLNVGGISGTAASASIGATGVSAGVSANLIEVSDTVDNAVFGNILQGTNATDRAVNNSSKVDVTAANLNAGALDGPAASAGISALGASAGVSLSAIAAPTAGTLGGDEGIEFGTIGQFVQNSGDAAVSSSSLTVDLSAASGIADSASISARGASASVGVTQVATGAALGGGDGIVEFGAITQDVINAASGSVSIASDVSITNSNGIQGFGSSASIAAVGASASFGMTSIDTVAMDNIQVASIDQTVVNSAPISNAAQINVGGYLGAATSAGISATGASVGVSFTAISTATP